MIKQVSHPVTGVGAADLTLALDVAYELHAPVKQGVARAPELAARQVTVLRTTAARPHHRRVPLNRPAALRG